MAYQMSGGDSNVVQNIRLKYKDRVAQYTDEEIAKTWREFSQSTDYEEDQERILDYLSDLGK